MKTQLEGFLGNCKFPHTCQCSIKSSFENTVNTLFFVYDEGGDSQQPVRIVSANDIYQLTVNNNSSQDICLVKVDKCLYPDEVSKCDCFLFDKNHFYLVEIKSCSAGTRGKRRKDAIAQLESSISLLQSQKIDLSNYRVTALVCFKSIEPRITQASRNSAAEVFREKYSAYLDEGNLINF